MPLIRPIQASDREQLITLSFIASPSMSSMPKDRKGLNLRIDRALATWARPASVAPHERLFLFAMEEHGRIIGFSGLRAALERDHRAFCLRQDPNLPLEWTLLDPHCSELCSLFLNTLSRHTGLGKALSFARFFYLRRHRHWFHDNLFASLRGWMLPTGHCPFWTALSRYSGNRRAQLLDFSTAHHLVATGIYATCDLISKPLPSPSQFPLEVQALLGKVHELTMPAQTLLLDLGFQQIETLDPLDAGPHYQVPTSELTILKQIVPRRLKLVAPPTQLEFTHWVMISPLQIKESDPFEIHLVKGALDEQEGVVRIYDPRLSDPRVSDPNSETLCTTKPTPSRLVDGDLVDLFCLDSLHGERRS